MLGFQIQTQTPLEPAPSDTRERAGLAVSSERPSPFAERYGEQLNQQRRQPQGRAQPDRPDTRGGNNLPNGERHRGQPSSRRESVPADQRRTGQARSARPERNAGQVQSSEWRAEAGRSPEQSERPSAASRAASAERPGPLPPLPARNNAASPVAGQQQDLLAAELPEQDLLAAELPGREDLAAVLQADLDTWSDIDLALAVTREAALAGESVEDWLATQLQALPADLVAPGDDFDMTLLERDDLIQALVSHGLNTPVVVGDIEPQTDAVSMIEPESMIELESMLAAESVIGAAAPIDTDLVRDELSDDTWVSAPAADDDADRLDADGESQTPLPSMPELDAEAVESLLAATDELDGDWLNEAPVEDLEQLVLTFEALQDLVRELQAAADDLDLQLPAGLTDRMLAQLQALAEQLDALPADLRDAWQATLGSDLTETLERLLDHARDGVDLTDSAAARQLLHHVLSEWQRTASAALQQAQTPAPVEPPGLMTRAMQAMQADLSADSDEREEPAPVSSRQERQNQREQALLSSLLGRTERDSMARTSLEDSGLQRLVTESPLGRDQRPAVAEQVRAHVERQMPIRYSTGEAARQLGERLVMMIGQEIQEARIRLDPPDMGALDIRITTQGDQVQVQIVAQQPMVRDLLEQQANRLREQLEQQGFTEVQVDITDREAAQDDLAEQEEGSGAGGDEEEGGAEADLTAGRREPVGLVDQYV
ncbi:hypothetical protein E4656_06125 [Natronospirillum operosum]|uniref:Flagellar hook-length control protein-like C-terminal domain-containing protein n=1 Tax=Natronospirillum operosum TaxID=2759953 RepID=A0A4Z0WKQ5_9GAMM|nr:flagellar hook-length control protein FliK [Natronospirillum operosum]TGG95971.1 hypothetical protein E4656_06125 [Natronospirillum operosum]